MGTHLLIGLDINFVHNYIIHIQVIFQVFLNSEKKVFLGIYPFVVILRHAQNYSSTRARCKAGII